MASQTQLDQRKRLKAAKEEAPLIDISDLVPNGPSEAEISDRLSKISKSPLYFLLMLRTPSVPITPGCKLYANVGKRDRKPDEMVVLEDGRIQTASGKIYRSIGGATQECVGSKTVPNGWNVAKIRHPVRPGKWVNLNNLFAQNWPLYGFDLDTLENEDRLREAMIKQGLITETDLGGTATLSPKITSSERNWEKNDNERHDEQDGGPK